MKYEESPARIEKLLAKPGGRRAVVRCDFLSRWPFSDSRKYLFRPYLGVGHEATTDILLRWMHEAGMEAHLDPAGNVLGRYEGHKPGAPALLIGSHVDSVKDAGSYDGMLGVMLGLELVEGFHRAGRRFPFALEVIGFGDEEGSRFPSYMLGSRAIAGILPPQALEASDIAGVTLVDALQDWGLEPTRFAEARRQPGEILAYLEAHIEQAPSLEMLDQPLGLVSSIAAQSRYYITVKGLAGHAGTMMSQRQDALTAAAEMILAIELIACQEPEDLVATVGSVMTSAGEATNIINGQVVFSVDLRAAHQQTRDRAATDIQGILNSIATRREVIHTVEERHSLSGASCDTRLNHMLKEAVQDVAGYTPPVMISQAGHDGMNVAALAPIAMLFLRCKDGISHNPAEAVRDEDVVLALATMQRFVEIFESRM